MNWGYNPFTKWDAPLHSLLISETTMPPTTVSSDRLASLISLSKRPKNDVRHLASSDRINEMTRFHLIP